MTVCAVIAEYNPLHEGHLHHLERTRALLGDGTRLVAVMSGHAVQRGEFPMFDKYARTEQALAAGFDLVFELPAPCACAPAERFARAAVSVAARLGIVTHLSFGAESGDLAALTSLSLRKPGAYPKEKSLAAAFPEILADSAEMFTPNNILALEYLRALRDLAPHVRPAAVRRDGSRHDGPRSAAAIRKEILQTGSIPSGTAFPHILQKELDAGRAPVCLFRQQGAVLSELRRMTARDYENLPDMGTGGFAQRLHAAASRAGTLAELYDLAKTKRFTMSRIRRCVLAAFLKFPRETPPHLRLLGIGRHGEELLSRVREPILSRPAAHRDALRLESAVTDQMTLCMPHPEPCGYEWRRGVVVRV